MLSVLAAYSLFVNLVYGSSPSRSAAPRLLVNEGQTNRRFV